jgi:hypothetical protein
MPGSEPLLDALMFRRKLEIAVQLGLVSKECAKAICVLNSIRNDFAHDLEVDELTEEDDRRMKSSLSARLETKARDCVSSDPGSVVGGWTRAGIAAIYNDLQHSLIEQLGEIKRAERARQSAPSA